MRPPALMFPRPLWSRTGPFRSLARNKRRAREQMTFNRLILSLSKDTPPKPALLFALVDAPVGGRCIRVDQRGVSA